MNIEKLKPHFNLIPRELLRRMSEDDFKNLDKEIFEYAAAYFAPDVNSFIDLVLKMGLIQFVYDYKYSDMDELGDDETIKLWEGLAPFLGKVYEKPLKLYYAIHKEEY
jgi:hypothetical protein